MFSMQLFAILAMLFFTGPSGFGPGKVARIFSESFQKVFKKFTESFQKVARILPESCQKVSRKLPESCQTVMRQSWDSLLLYFSCSLYGHVCSCLFNEWISEWVSDPPIEWPHDHGLPFRQRPWKKGSNFVVLELLPAHGERFSISPCGSFTHSVR